MKRRIKPPPMSTDGASEAEVLDAELVPSAVAIPVAFDVEAKAAHRVERLQWAGAGVFVAVVLVLLLSATVQNFTKASMDDEPFDGPWWATPLQDRHTMDLPMDTLRAQLPVNGTYEVLPYTEHFVEVDLPASEEDIGTPEDDVMHVALWLPDVPEGTKVPVIMTIHPYYDFGGEGIAGADSAPNTVPDGGVGKWVYDTFVPHGYALAQASTFGTGKSTHCQDVKGLGEQVGIQAVVEWLGEQEWSNGHVGLMGKSYAGTTNWEAAQNPSPYLKTIVPISGSIGVQEMFYRNGSSESRAMLYDALYEGSTADATTDDMRMCTDDAIGPLNPFTTWAGADFGGAEWNDYWDERRHLPDVLENYEGSVYLVWGLQDWNVDPYHAFPTYQLLRDAGIHARAIAGQWAHNYPDQPDRHGELSSGYGAEAYPNTSRMDWAVELYAWFEWFLKGEGEEPEQHVQVQTNDGRWHVESTWPPEDLSWWSMGLDEGQADGSIVNNGASIEIVFPPLEQEIHASGMPTLHLSASTRTCNGGQVFATLYADDLRLGHATMDIRYRDGGMDAAFTSPLSEYLMLMEFNPLDVVVPAGKSLRLVLSESGEDYLPSPCAAVGLSVSTGSDSVFSLPLIDRPPSDERWFLAPAWWEQQPIP
jgi:predicted acyl esterase